MKNLTSFVLLLTIGSLCWWGCSDDDANIISDLQFEIETDPLDPLQVEVRPSSKTSKRFEVYFDYDNAKDEFHSLSPGETITHEYPESSATYSIRVVGKADGYQDAELTRSHQIQFTPGFLISDFEANRDVIHQGREQTLIELADNPDVSEANSSNSVGKITVAGEFYKAFVIYPSKFIDLSDPAQQIISFDYYQDLEVEVPLLIRFSTNSTPTFDEFTGEGDIASDGILGEGDAGSVEGGSGDGVGEGVGQGDFGDSFGAPLIEAAKEADVEVLQSVNHRGWKRVRFNFARDRRNSTNPEDDAQDLGQYDRVFVFIGYRDNATGTFYIDNLRGGLEGDPIPDQDEDGVLDNADVCDERPGEVENDGCPTYDGGLEGPTDTTPAPTG